MNRFLQTLKNIWSIEELRNKILFTLIAVAVFRIGSHIILPGIVSTSMSQAYGSSGQPADLLGLINTFTGGAFLKGSILALGIMPYITASIIVQLLGFAVPYFQRLQSKEGESGRKRLNQITRLLTVFITLVQGGAYLTLISQTPRAISPNVDHGIFWISGIIILSTGTIFAMWLGEKITDRGIGNGISLLIMIGIIARLPQTFVGEVLNQFAENNLFMLILELALIFLVIIGTIMIVQGVRKIPLQYAKRMVGRSSSSLPVMSNRDFLPIKVNAAGVMPIIFAQAIIFLPAMLGRYLAGDGGVNSDFLRNMSDWKSFSYNLIFFLLIVLFTYVYTALIINPTQNADFLKRQNAFIPGVKPGQDTADYIDSITSKITLPGSIFLGLIAIFPAIVARLGVGDGFALFFGGTSLLILVAVVLDTLQQIESYLLLRKYESLSSQGKIKGRGVGMQIGADI
ncbi:MAG TPA: preprotein translocase subunit SecY [Saprospiraceae bacterium]|nr:preprotein translocase subunit SecY [Lewinellaceae bacterium]HPK10303.1 preprotein translocase subunit SecY [Saprospiraceae bacterium]HPQ21547.1 preprotein translocase subunit SecY [Saprospiraceae bacterium]